MARTQKIRSRCDIALLVDDEVGDYTEDGTFVPARGSVEHHVLRTLRTQHQRVEIVPFSQPLADTLLKLQALKPRLVFNLTEWIDGDRTLDAAIAGMLDALGIPYTGTGPAGLCIARDKVLAKGIVAALGFATPRHCVLTRQSRGTGDLRYPVFVKLPHGDGSDGIGVSALIRTPAQLARRVARLAKSETLLCEEYIPGRDLFVGVLGNGPDVMPALELMVGRKDRGAPTHATSRIKVDAAYRKRWRIGYRIPKLAPYVERDIVKCSSAIFHALRLRDYARIDYRLGDDGRLYFLEANPNPDLLPNTFGRNGCFAGVAYPELISSIVRFAYKRNRQFT